MSWLIGYLKEITCHMEQNEILKKTTYVQHLQKQQQQQKTLFPLLMQVLRNLKRK